jgi:hypothetical protein
MFAGSVIATPSPGWRAWFCLGIDVAPAVVLAAMLWGGQVVN